MDWSHAISTFDHNSIKLESNNKNNPHPKVLMSLEVQTKQNKQKKKQNSLNNLCFKAKESQLMWDNE